MAIQSAIFTRMETTPTIITPTLTKAPAPDPWAHETAKVETDRNIEALTQAFGDVVKAAQWVAEATARATQGAEYAEQGMYFTTQMAEKAQLHAKQAIPAPGRRYPDIGAAKHAAKANNYSAHAKANASLTERAARATTSYQEVTTESQGDARRASERMARYAERLPACLQEAAQHLRLRTQTIIDQVDLSAQEALRQAARARTAAETVQDAVKDL